ncbi:unnamed protein product [Trichogramma brassicae]|uniref:Uncharacterized protein n=1 Tax=Trichogramma brassicae TaxID=86971 RepID=A0A6H5IM84_9HYME|nr:unnamed protein product [Trichogramma brassicae]
MSIINNDDDVDDADFPHLRLTPKRPIARTGVCGTPCNGLVDRRVPQCADRPLAYMTVDEKLGLFDRRIPYRARAEERQKANLSERAAALAGQPATPHHGRRESRHVQEGRKVASLRGPAQLVHSAEGHTRGQAEGLPHNAAEHARLRNPVRPLQARLAAAPQVRLRRSHQEARRFSHAPGQVRRPLRVQSREAGHTGDDQGVQVHGAAERGHQDRGHVLQGLSLGRLHQGFRQFHGRGRLGPQRVDQAYNRPIYKVTPKSLPFRSFAACSNSSINSSITERTSRCAPRCSTMEN